MLINVDTDRTITDRHSWCHKEVPQPMMEDSRELENSVFKETLSVMTYNTGLVVDRLFLLIWLDS